MANNGNDCNAKHANITCGDITYGMVIIFHEIV